jgi:hypothetical protein
MIDSGMMKRGKNEYWLAEPVNDGTE